MLKYIFNRIESMMLPSWGFEYNAGYLVIHQTKQKSTVI